MLRSILITATALLALSPLPGQHVLHYDAPSIAGAKSVSGKVEKDFIANALPSILISL